MLAAPWIFDGWNEAKEKPKKLAIAIGKRGIGKRGKIFFVKILFLNIAVEVNAECTHREQGVRTDARLPQALDQLLKKNGIEKGII